MPQTVIADIDRDLLAALDGVILHPLEIVAGWCGPQLRVWE
jgi:hypothetical protein